MEMENSIWFNSKDITITYRDHCKRMYQTLGFYKRADITYYVSHHTQKKKAKGKIWWEKGPQNVFQKLKVKSCSLKKIFTFCPKKFPSSLENDYISIIWVLIKTRISIQRSQSVSHESESPGVRCEQWIVSTVPRWFWCTASLGN